MTVRFNVCSAEKDTKGSSVLLLPLVSFSAEQTLVQEFGLGRKIITNTDWEWSLAGSNRWLRSVAGLCYKSLLKLVGEVVEDRGVE